MDETSRDLHEGDSLAPGIRTDGELLAYMGDDAERWTQEFTLHLAALTGGDPEEVAARMDPAPGDWLHGWFANAIEAGRSAGTAPEAFSGTAAPGQYGEALDLYRGKDGNGPFEVSFSGKEIPVVALARVANARMEQKGLYSDEHDDKHDLEELVSAACALAMWDGDAWPFPEPMPLYEDRKQRLAMAAALLVAEIERIARLESRDDS